MNNVAPKGWIDSPLGKFLKFRRGTTYVASELSEDEYNHPLYITMKSFKVGGGYSSRGDKYFSAPYEQKQVVEQDEILLANTDVTSSCDILGAPLILPQEKLSKDTLFSHHVTAVKILDDGDKNFLFFLLSSASSRQAIQALGRGTTVKMLDMKDIEKLSFSIPPLPEQKKIAAILTSVDEVLENTQKQISKLQELKKATMNELLTKGIGHTEFKNSELGRIPDNWKIRLLKEVVQDKGIQTGPFGSQLHAHEYTESGTPVVMPKDMKPPFLTTESIARIPEDRAITLENNRVSPGDILFSRRGDIGRFALITESNSGWVCGTGCLRVRLDRKTIHPFFIAQYLTLTYPVEWLNLNAVGLTMRNLSTAILSDLPILIPPLEEQTEIANILLSIDSGAQRCKEYLCKQEQLKKSLMQDLLTGKVRVKI